MAEADTPLTSLCAICHVNPLKYTCPRCGIHTCSLPCVKLHKTRAQCSGVRNPAEYRRRFELASEASFDKDFNFITSVERNLQRADEDVTEKKIDLRPANIFNFKGGTALDKAAEARDVKLIRAPMGLSRRKENKSKVLGKEGNISWTVEWIGRNEKRRVQNHDELKTIGEAYFICHPKKYLGKKRKRGQAEPEQDKKEATQEQNHTPAREGAPIHAAKQIPGPDRTGSHLEQAHELGQRQESPFGLLEPPVALRGGDEKKPMQKPAPDGARRPEQKERLPSQEELPSIPEDMHFYLHRPQTSSKIKCLIPILATDTIQDALKGKKIVEFPTIYVRNEAPEALSEPFVLESTYLEQHGEDVMVPPHPALLLETVSPPAGPSVESIDSQKVLEVLKQDLISV